MKIWEVVHLAEGMCLHRPVVQANCLYIYVSVGGSVLVSRAEKKKELDRHFWGYKPKPSHVHVHLKGCRTIKR